MHVTAKTRIDRLAAANPWPAERPDLEFDPHGWCLPEHREHVAPFLGERAKVVLELGAWLGQSTRMLLELAPNATVISVDTWRGSTDMADSPEAVARIESNNLYDQFLANQWDHRHRLIPIVLPSLEGMGQVAAAGVQPDLVFFDTEHTATHLTAELELARRLFPRARLYGDDWGWVPVRAAVEHFARGLGKVAHGIGNAWAIVTPDEYWAAVARRYDAAIAAERGIPFQISEPPRSE